MLQNCRIFGTNEAILLYIYVQSLYNSLFYDWMHQSQPFGLGGAVKLGEDHWQRCFPRVCSLHKSMSMSVANSICECVKGYYTVQQYNSGESQLSGVFLIPGSITANKKVGKKVLYRFFQYQLDLYRKIYANKLHCLFYYLRKNI